MFETQMDTLQIKLEENYSVHEENHKHTQLQKRIDSLELSDTGQSSHITYV